MPSHFIQLWHYLLQVSLRSLWGRGLRPHSCFHFRPSHMGYPTQASALLAESQYSYIFVYGSDESAWPLCIQRRTQEEIPRVAYRRKHGSSKPHVIGRKGSEEMTWVGKSSQAHLLQRWEIQTCPSTAGTLFHLRQWRYGGPGSWLHVFFWLLWP